MRIGYCPSRHSSYGIATHIKEEIAAGMQAARAEIVCCESPADTKDVDGVFLINWMPNELISDLSKRVPHVFLLLIDAPFYHADWIVKNPKAIQYGVVDPTHQAFLKLFHRPSIFLPHGGSLHTAKPWDQRDIDVLFTGTAPRPDLITEKINQQPVLKKELTWQLVEMAIKHPGDPLLSLLHMLLLKNQWDLPFSHSLQVLRLADSMIRARHRADLLRAFSEFSVVLVGSGWDDVERFPRHQWIGEIPLSQVAELMSRAKIVLCPSCGFGQGAHDRLLTAMGSGAVALTMPTSFLEAHFIHGSHIAYFNELAEANALGHTILDQPDWEMVGLAGQQIVKTGHTWAQRGKDIVALFRQAMPRVRSSSVGPRILSSPMSVEEGHDIGVHV